MFKFKLRLIYTPTYDRRTVQMVDQGPPDRVGNIKNPKKRSTGGNLKVYCKTLGQRTLSQTSRKTEYQFVE